MIENFITQIVSVALLAIGAYYVIFSLVRWLRTPAKHWSPAPTQPEPPPKCERCLELERELKLAQRERRMWESRANAHRAAIPKLHSILMRVRDHHLSGWKMADNGMCPICVESKLFERVQTMFGSMQFWSDERTPRS